MKTQIKRLLTQSFSTLSYFVNCSMSLTRGYAKYPLLPVFLFVVFIGYHFVGIVFKGIFDEYYN